MAGVSSALCSLLLGAKAGELGESYLVYCLFKKRQTWLYSLLADCWI